MIYSIQKKMEKDKNFIRHLALFSFDRGMQATQAVEEICSIYGQVLEVRTCQKWFKRFRGGDRSLQILPGRGRPVTLDVDLLAQELDNDPRQTQRELAAKLQWSKKAVQNGLKKLGKVYKKGKWTPHQLSDDNKMTRVAIASSLLARYALDPFLERIVTGDEKWILYCNVTRKGEWISPEETPAPTPRAGLHPMKVMLSIWWDFQGYIHLELLPTNTTITKEVYCAQLDRLNQELKNKRHHLVSRKGVILHHDNAKPHTAKMTLSKIQELGWEILPHPPYSPDLAPSDYHLFRSLQNFLRGKFYDNVKHIENDLKDFLASKPVTFFWDGIDKLTSRWREVVERNGEYVID